MNALHHALVACLALLALLLGGQAGAATYTFRSDVYSWETAANAITWDRTCTDYPGDDDKATINFTGGFTFTFAGTAHSSVRVLTNGMLQFGADTGLFRDYDNAAMPAGTATARNGACVEAATTSTLMAYWTDLDPSRVGSGGVTWQQKGTAPNRYVVVSWNNVYEYGTSTPYAFQVILYENGEFKYQYGNANATGSNATIGVQVSATDYTQYSHNSGYNANGTAIRWVLPSGLPDRVAEYRMDETTWNGTIGEVTDSSGNGHPGVRVGSATSNAGGYVCRALDIPANTNTTSSAVDSSLDIDSAVGATGSLSLWVRSNVVWTHNTAALIFDATSVANRPFYFMRNGGGALRLSVSDSAGSVLVATTAPQNFAANTWVHVAATWRLAAGTNQSTLRIYINGTQAAAVSGTTTGSLDSSLRTLFLGDNRSALTPAGGTVNSFNGRLDEVRVYNYEISGIELGLDMAVAHSCVLPVDHIEVIPDSSSGSTCAASAVTVKACANAACSSLLGTYAGTVLLNTSSVRGNWSTASGPAPQGTLNNGTANDGAASYVFSALDNGQARLQLTHSLALNVTVTGSDNLLPATSRTSTAMAFRDNTFVLAEDSGNLIAGADVAVAGRPHDHTVSLIKKDPATGSCGVATDFSGSRALKIWRTDNAGGWTAPSVVSPAVSVPAAAPGTSNLNLNFTNGVATFNLGTTDIGRYSLNLLDDSLSYASASISGATNILTVRPFALVVQAIRQGATHNPAGALATDAVFAKAGSHFEATLGAYRWTTAMTANGTDSNNDGRPDATASLANTTAGGLAASFNSSMALTVAAGHTPAGGVPGALNNAAISGFSGGTATATTLQYTEVGSFALNTAAVVNNFLGSGLTLDATVFTAAGVQNNRVGRFIPARFALSGSTITQRVNAACTPASSFTYLGENFQLQFTLTAQNALGGTTANYTGSFARLDPAIASVWQLAGIAGSTAFLSTGGTPRLSIGAATGSWSNGVAAGVTLGAAALRGTTVDGPFTAAFGIAPTDSDGVQMASHDLDADAAALGNDRSSVGTLALRFGRLRLMNGMGSQDRSLSLPLVAQYWNGSAFADNTLDSCTRVPATSVNFGNYRKTLTAADTSISTTPVALTAGRGSLVLARPIAGHAGTVDIALSLGSTAPDASCLQTWTPGTGDTATAGANLAFLRGAWCSTSHDKDPSARASFGLYRGADHLIYQRENY